MDLVNGPVAKTLFIFSFPFMLSTLLQTLYSTTDTIVVGQVLGSSGLSAVSNGSQLMTMVYMVCIGIANGGQVLIAQAKGAGDRGKLQRIIGSLFIIQTVMCVVIGVICLIFSKQLLSLLQTPPEAYEQANYYIIICSIGILFTGFYNMLSSVLRGMGDSKHPLIFVLIATSLNIVLDIIFVAGFKWDVAGAAVATVIGQAVSVIISLIFLARHSEEFGVDFHIRNLRPDVQFSKQILALGFPMAVQGAAIQLSFLFVGRLINMLGVNESAAFGVMTKVRSIPAFIVQGFGLGEASMVGQNLGAGKQERVQQTVKYCIFFSAAVYAVAACFYLLAPNACFRLFTQDPAVLAFAKMCMTILAIELPAFTVMPACNGLVNAQGFIALSLTVSFLDAFAGRVLLSWGLGSAAGLGAFGYFLGYTLATYVTGIIVFVYFVSGLWKKRAALV